DITAVLRVPGLPLETLRGCSMHLDRIDGEWRVLIEAGPGGGTVLLQFDEEGLLRVRSTAMPVSSAYTLFMPEDGDLLARELRPEGLLTLSVERRAEDDYAAHGVLEQATLRPPRVPFPLERVSLPFEYEDDRFHLKDARLGFDGGELRTSVEHQPGGMVIALDVVDARFRADYLDLFPQTRDLPWLRAEDGGNIELHLRIEETDEVRVRGWGGVLVERMWVGETQVEVEDVVGSFDIRDTEVVLRETSGVCAGGLVRVRGRTDAATGEVELDASVFDVDLAQVRRALSPPESLGGEVTGWLQGEVHYEGRIGDPSTGRGAGQLSVRGGNLWNVKVLNAILTALGSGRPEPSERHRLELRFEIRGEDYRIETLRLKSAFLSLLGEGRVRRHSELDVEIIPISVPIGPLGDLLEYVERQIVKVEVRGTLEDPQVNVLPIKVVTQPVGSFWSWLTGLFRSEPEPAPPGTP
ncbi:MAG: AsmA family protein, partial [Planctomycetota bacterium]